MFSRRSRAALLGSMALLACFPPSAKADELSALKDEITRLQNRLEPNGSQEGHGSAAPAGSVSVIRGRGVSGAWKTDRAGDIAPDEGGLTILVTPSADLPSPLHEVTLSGYVKGDVIYDFDEDLGDEFDYGRITRSRQRGHARLHARQTRFSIKSNSETSVGVIRTLIEGDFFGKDETDFRLRHAWGEWDATPQLTFGAGQHWRNFMSPFTGISTVDFNGDAGLIGWARSPQLRLTWQSGPATAALSVENPTGAKDLAAYGSDFSPDAKRQKPAGAADTLPDIAARLQYDLPGGHQLLASGMMRNYHVARIGDQQADDALGWGVQGAVNVSVADPVLLTASVMYGEGLGNYVLGAPFGAFTRNGKIQLVPQLGLFAGTSILLSDTTTLNLGWGYLDQKDADIVASGARNATVDLMSVHANVIWQPVQQLRLGAEVMWGQREHTTGNPDEKQTDEAWRGQFGAWFFF
ncbi:porin [Rhodoligotrophos defluvii]|uniref:porin n=1 Tax=Rhodoligotrophos defluvii TaxID=2561934 RepID=UPI0010CA1E06|nr:porin [Rhodoligotrophos defluvii]